MGTIFDSKIALEPRLFEPNKKPTGLVQMQRSGIASDFHSFYLTAPYMYDLVRKGILTVSSSGGSAVPWEERSQHDNFGTYNPGPSGGGWTYLDTEDSVYCPDHLDYTILIHFVHDTTNGIMTVLGWGFNNYGVRFDIGDSSGALSISSFTHYQSGANQFTSHTFSAAVATNTPIALVFGTRGTTPFICANGEYWDNTGATFIAPTAGSDREKFTGAGWADFMSGTVWSFGKILRGVTPAEAVALTTNLYGEILEPVL